MCECGCNSMDIEKAWRMTDGNVLALSVYPGCENCFRGVGVTLYLFDKEGERQWLEGIEIQELPQADEFGSNSGIGISVPLVDIEEIIKATRADPVHDNMTGYDETAEWVNDNLFQILRRNVLDTVAKWKTK